MTASKKSTVPAKPRAAIDLLRLPPPVRTLTDEQAVARDLLGQALVNLFAEAPGATALGARMSEHAGRPVSQPLVAHWLAGRYPMQRWAIEALAATWERGERELRERHQAMYVGKARMLRVAALAAEDGK